MFRIYKIKLFAFIFTFLLSNLVSSTCLASLSQNFSVGNAKSIALGHAVTADPPGLDSIHYNPAGLVKLDGRQRQFNFVLGSFSLEAEFGEHNDEFIETLNGLTLNGEPIYGVEDDRVRQSSSETDGAAVMLPGVGLLELPFLALLTGGMSIQLSDPGVTLATMVYAPDAAGYTRPEDDTGRLQGSSLAITQLAYFTPTIAFRATDELSIGISLILTYQGLGFELDMRSTNIFTALSDGFLQGTCLNGGNDPILCENSLSPFDEVGTLNIEAENVFSPSFNIGILWEPTLWLTIGATYRHGGSTKLKGTYEYTYRETWTNFWSEFNGDGLIPLLPVGKAKDEGDVELTLISPRHIALGTKIALTPRLRVNLDIKWTEYSSWEKIEFEFGNNLDFLNLASVFSDDADPDRLVLNQFYEDSISYSLGLSYQWNDRLDLRVGYEDRPTAVPNDRADVFLPFGDAFLMGAGFEYKTDSAAIVDVALAYVHAEADVKGGESLNANSTSPEHLIYNPYPGLAFTTEVNAFLLEINYRSKF